MPPIEGLREHLLEYDLTYMNDALDPEGKYKNDIFLKILLFTCK